MASKRGNPDHDTPPKDPRHKRNKRTEANSDSDQTPSYCLVCSNVIVDCNPDKNIEGDDAMFCKGMCNAWVHRTCVGLSKQSYTALTEDDTPYLCPHCSMKQQSSVIQELSANTHIGSAFKQMESHLLSSFQEMISTSVASLKSTIESEVKVLQSKFSELSERVKVLESTNDKVVDIQDRLQQLEVSIGKHPAPPKNISNSVPPTSLTSDVSVITSTVTSLLKEEREREERKLNLIIHGVPESPSETPMDRKAYDIKQVSRVLNEVLEVDSTVEDAVRLGKRDPSKKRLIKVSVSSMAVKKAVLRNSFKLRSKSILIG